MNRAVKLIRMIEKMDMKALRRSNLPPTEGNWAGFAEAFDVGVTDLDEIAVEMGYKDFEDLDISISPKSLLRNKGKRFITVIRKVALSAEDMSDSEVKQLIIK